MAVIALEGFVENGKIRLPENASLPENAKVYVLIAEPDGKSAVVAHLPSPRLANPVQFNDFRKQMEIGDAQI
jgi:hypothetical protein